MATFDSTFDYTFQDTSSTSTPQSANTFADCRVEGYTLGWLTNCGWAYWLFEGRAVIGQEVAPVASFRQRGTTYDTQRLTQAKTLLRTGGLTRPEAQVVATLQSSVSVYWLKDTGGTVTPIRVYVVPEELPVWNEAEKNGYMEFTILQEQTYSLRN